MPVIQSWAKTDVGRKRKHNEDSFLADAQLGLFMVADGMGGHAAGEVASAIAVQAVKNTITDSRPAIEAFSKSPTAEAREEVAKLMERAILRACAEIYATATSDLGKRGMGTTCVALLALGRKAVIGHVGDSRVYLFRPGRAHPLTDAPTDLQ